MNTESATTIEEIAENYVNGNLSDVKKALTADCDNLTSIGRAMCVYERLRGWNGSLMSLQFANWLQKHSDIE